MRSALAGWQPETEDAADVVTAAMAAALHGLLDAPGPPPAASDPLPPLWHWLAFSPRVPQRKLGDDGHPRTGHFLPPVAGRRMWAGGRLTFAEATSDGSAAAGGLRVGEPLHRRSRVTDVAEKEGRSGRLVFVTVDHRLGPNPTAATRDGIDPPVHEVQDIVYRPPVDASSASAASPPSGPPADVGQWDWGLDLEPDATMLFRFSALTYNAHRIHYDRAYATEVEGYPGLVVHGPLQAIALADLCRRHLADRPLTSFRFRGVRPAFDGRLLRLRGRVGGDGTVLLNAFDPAGEITTSAEAALNPAPRPRSGLPG